MCECLPYDIRDCNRKGQYMVDAEIAALSAEPPKPKKKSKPKAKKPAVKKKAVNGTGRSERLDLRLTKAEKAKLAARAKKSRRTITSIMLELVEKMK